MGCPVLWVELSCLRGQMTPLCVLSIFDIVEVGLGRGLGLGDAGISAKPWACQRAGHLVVAGCVESAWVGCWSNLGAKC